MCISYLCTQDTKEAVCEGRGSRGSWLEVGGDTDALSPGRSHSASRPAAAGSTHTHTLMDARLLAHITAESRLGSVCAPLT